MADSAPRPAEAKDRAKIGESFRLGNFSYTIAGASMTTLIGDTYPTSGAVFVVVNYSIRNESNKTRTAMTNDFVLKDAESREFSPSANANTALSMTGQVDDFILTELQPGLTKQSMVAFEIPAAAFKGELILVVPEKGWGAGKREIVIKKASK